MARKILILEDQPQWKDLLNTIFYPPLYTVEITNILQKAKELLESSSFDGAIINIHCTPQMPDFPAGLALLEFIQQEYPFLPRIILTAKSKSLNPIRKTLEFYDIDEMFDKSAFTHTQLRDAIDNAIIKRHPMDDAIIQVSKRKLIPKEIKITSQEDFIKWIEDQLNTKPEELIDIGKLVVKALQEKRKSSDDIRRDNILKMESALKIEIEDFEQCLKRGDMTTQNKRNLYKRIVNSLDLLKET